MSKLLWWVPDSFMIVPVVLIALGLIVGLIRPRRAGTLIGLVVFVLLSGPFIDALLAFIWSILPLWLILLAIPFLLLWLAMAISRFFLGAAADTMVGYLAARTVLWTGRQFVRAVTFPFRAVMRRSSLRRY